MYINTIKKTKVAIRKQVIATFYELMYEFISLISHAKQQSIIKIKFSVSKINIALHK